MLFIVCNFKMPHPIHDILFLVHTVHLQLEILYAFPTPPTTSSPSLFRGCTFMSFGHSLPFRYASQVRLKLHPAIKSLFHFLHCPSHSNLHCILWHSNSPCTKVSTRNWRCQGWGLMEGRHVERTQQDQSLFILEELNSAKVGNPLYLNSSHVVRAKPLHSSLHQKQSPSLKKNPFLCQFHFIFLNDLTINVLLFHPRVVWIWVSFPEIPVHQVFFLASTILKISDLLSFPSVIFWDNWQWPSGFARGGQLRVVGNIFA